MADETLEKVKRLIAQAKQHHIAIKANPQSRDQKLSSTGAIDLCVWLESGLGLPESGQDEPFPES